MKRTSLVLMLLLFGLHSRPAAAETIRPDDVLRLTFSLPAVPVCAGQCDVILFSLGLATNPPDPTSASLFDGSTLLGTFKPDVDCLRNGTCVSGVPSFVALASIYGLHSPIIDFTSIRNGRIDGRLDFTVTTPIDFEFGSPDTFVRVGHAFGVGGSEGGLRGTILSETLVQSPQPTPEPGSLFLLSSAITAMVVRSRRARGRVN
jgi:hypothetical protein